MDMVRLAQHCYSVAVFRMEVGVIIVKKSFKKGYYLSCLYIDMVY